MAAFFASLFLILLAEMGDKTQLVALSFAARMKPAKVIIGIFLGTLISHLLAVLIGRNLDLIVPVFYLKMAVGLSFIVFGIWSLKGDTLNAGKGEKISRFGPVVTVAIAFFLAELGDKTQLATMSLAAEYPSILAVWSGSTLGMVLADGLAIVIGVVAGKKLPEKSVKFVSCLLFLIFGLLIILEGFKVIR